jgi:hypothetical protein
MKDITVVGAVVVENITDVVAVEVVGVSVVVSVVVEDITGVVALVL